MTPGPLDLDRLRVLATEEFDPNCLERDRPCETCQLASGVLALLSRLQASEARVRELETAIRCEIDCLPGSSWSQSTTYKRLASALDAPALHAPPGSIEPTRNVPILRNFNPAEPPIGIADITVEGDNVFAEVRSLRMDKVSGLYPALGGMSEDASSPGPADRVLISFKVFSVGLCDSPNTDPDIPPVPPRSEQ